MLNPYKTDKIYVQLDLPLIPDKSIHLDDSNLDLKSIDEALDLYPALAPYRGQIEYANIYEGIVIINFGSTSIKYEIKDFLKHTVPNLSSPNDPMELEIDG